MDRKYEEALRRLAESNGMTPAEFEARLKEMENDLPPSSPQCLTVVELGVWPELSRSRFTHASNCSFCLKMLEAFYPL